MAAVSLIRGALSLALVAGCGAALAQPSAVSWPNVVLKYATDGTPILHPRVAAASTAAGGGAATLNAAQKLAIGNAVANLQLTRNVPLLNVAKLARIAAWGVGPLALLGLALDAYEYVNGVWLTAPEVDPSLHLSGQWRPYNSAPAAIRGEFRGTPEAACDVWFAYKGYTKSSVAFYSGSVGHYSPGDQWKCTAVEGGGIWTTVIRDASTFPGCAGGVGVDSKGLCLPGGGSVPGTQEGLEADIAAALQAQPSLAGQVLDRALQDSQARAELVADAMGISGPATVDGGTKTSTRVDTAGTTTIQTATTYNLSYQGDTVNVTQTRVETVTDPQNQVTTTTTTTAAPTGEPPPPEERSKFCEDFPDASACEELGEPEEQAELPSEDRDLSFDQELSDAGSCPGPYSLSILGRSYSLEWTPLCDLASGVRPVVIALAWLSAIVFVFAVGSRTT
jgi:hypothetical protein